MVGDGVQPCPSSQSPEGAAEAEPAREQSVHPAFIACPARHVNVLPETADVHPPEAVPARPAPHPYSGVIAVTVPAK